ncbi:hypothetical protein [Ktedonobacter racemifer]|uniref:Uncharacterized protein n=1 Tax=Ktedonobacter racemifer DSM 44963 TaxID=485913 RepID=D6TKZ8_KTERA|nr:hypothetical protein [Ktedonobacter racemifer]EFH86448.1 hypothetical protein Krac_7747 [Ktedonobacter racemifer DSM 44963]
MRELSGFRQQLDNLLRTRDVERIQTFMIENGQWYEGTPADVEYAMWLMIGGSQNLSDLHEEAREWLVAHGHESAAEALLGKAGAKGGSSKGRVKQQPRGKQAQGRKPAAKGERGAAKNTPKES